MSKKVNLNISNESKKSFQSVLDLIEQHARNTPSETAIKHNSSSINFDSLSRRSSFISLQLMQMGVKKGDFVGLYFSHSDINILTALLGILKAGAAYVPLSGVNPIQRTSKILNSSSCNIILGPGEAEKELHALKNEIDYYSIETILEEIGVYDDNRRAEIKRGDIAYVLFTSGSTGSPKGVKISHENLGFYTQWSRNFFKNTVDNKLPLTSGLNFAAAISQIFSSLTAGKPVHILNNVLTEPKSLFDWYTDHREFGLYCVPSVWLYAVEWCKERTSTEIVPPKALYLSGEKVTRRLVIDTMEMFPAVDIYNLYGPTEAVANLSYKKIETADNINIGSPLQNTSFYVVDSSEKEVQTGESGLLYVSGPGLSPGYLGEKEKTDSVFFNFESAANGLVRAYNTGDQVLKLEDDEYQFIGRQDRQIKINGQRLELGEIENILSNHPSVVVAVVKYYEEEEMLIGYVQTREGESLTISEIRTFLKDYLPEVMIPQRWKFLDSFPLLPNGKIDRNSISLPQIDYADISDEFIDSSTEVESAIQSIFSEVLNIDKVGVHDNFYALGGNSLKAITIISKINQNLNRQISYSRFFNDPTVKGVSENSTELRRDESFREEPDYDYEKIPLTQAQKALLFFQQANPENAAYNITYALNLKGEIDIENIEEALESIVRNNPQLGLELKSDDTDVYFSYSDNHIVDIQLKDVELLSPDENLSYVYEDLSTKASEAFNLLDEKLYRLYLYRRGENRFTIGLIIHHIIFDGSSYPYFIDELFQYIDGKEVENVKKLRINDVVEHQHKRNTLKNAVHDQQVEFWKNYLGGIESFNGLPSIYSQDDNTIESKRINIEIEDRVYSEIQVLCEKHNITPNMLLLTAFGVCLFAFDKSREYLIATPVTIRKQNNNQPYLGYLINTLFVKLRCHKDKRLIELLKQVKNDIINIVDNRDLVLQELVSILRENNVNVPNSGFKTLFAYHDAHRYEGNRKNINYSSRELGNKHAKCELQLECYEFPDSIKIEMTYAINKLHDDLALHFINLYKTILTNILENGVQLRLSDSYLQDHKDNIFQKLHHGYKRDYKYETLHELFELSCEKNREAVAIRYRGESVTYKELECKVNSTAYRLSTLEDESFLGIYMNHSPDLIIGMLACARAGIPYVPLDPSFPDARINYILEHSKVKTILTDKSIDDQLKNDNIKKLNVEELYKSETTVKTDVLVDGNELLYLLYTSGSTGNPKGVKVKNKSVANLLQWMKDEYDFNESSKFLAKTSVSFDISVCELFTPLISGGTVVIEDRADVESPEEIAEIVQKESVNMLQFVPSGLKIMSDSAMLSQISVDKIFSGGERLHQSLVEDVLSQVNGDLINLYGPTETVVYVSSHKCSLKNKYTKVPIGKPIYNSSIYILDNENRSVPIGTPGEIHIGGCMLADGYLFDESQTEKKFISWNEGTGERLYKSGDIGRMLPDGRIEFLGRNDHQVKIRGYRVELGEIESTILNYKSIHDCVVNKVQHGEMDNRLHTAFIARNEVDVAELKTYLKRRLPQYMIPVKIKQVDEFPTLPNEKIDRNAVKKSTLNSEEKEHTMNYVVNDKSENKIYDVWKEVLGSKDFSTDDNFFDVGGHSVLFLKMRDLLNERLSVDFSIVELYQYPNIKKLAKRYKEKISKGDDDKISKIKNRINRKRRNYGKRRQ